MITAYKWRHRFRKHVSRWTLHREAILDLLSRMSKHMSAKEIYNSFSKVYPGIGLSTTYRTLGLLVRAGFLNKMDIGGGQSRYEFKSGEKDEDLEKFAREKHKKIIYHELYRVLRSKGIFSLYPKHHKNDSPLMELAHMKLEDIIKEV